MHQILLPLLLFFGLAVTQTPYITPYYQVNSSVVGYTYVGCYLDNYSANGNQLTWNGYCPNCNGYLNTIEYCIQTYCLPNGFFYCGVENVGSPCGRAVSVYLSCAGRGLRWRKRHQLRCIQRLAAG